jgi:hypothetical protein
MEKPNHGSGPAQKLDGDIIGCIAMNYAQSVVTFGSGAVSAADY